MPQLIFERALRAQVLHPSFIRRGLTAIGDPSPAGEPDLDGGAIFSHELVFFLHAAGLAQFQHHRPVFCRVFEQRGAGIQFHQLAHRLEAQNLDERRVCSLKLLGIVEPEDPAGRIVDQRTVLRLRTRQVGV